MAKYRQKQPTIIVDAQVWDPANGKPHIGVAAEKLPDGTFSGTIHHVTGNTQPGIKPGSVIVTHAGVPAGAPDTYEAMLPDEFEAYYEPLVESPKKPGAKELAASNDKDVVPPTK